MVFNTKCTINDDELNIHRYAVKKQMNNLNKNVNLEYNVHTLCAFSIECRYINSFCTYLYDLLCIICSFLSKQQTRILNVLVTSSICLKKNNLKCGFLVKYNLQVVSSSFKRQRTIFRFNTNNIYKTWFICSDTNSHRLSIIQHYIHPIRKIQKLHIIICTPFYSKSLI